MRERAKIIVNNREVAKRYLGTSLVWMNDPSLILELKGARIWKYWGGYNIDIGDNRIDVRRIKYVEVDGNLVKLEQGASSFRPRTVYIDSQKSLKDFNGNYDVKFYDKSKGETT